MSDSPSVRVADQGERQPSLTAAPTIESPWPVRLLGLKLRDYIDRLGSVWVEGELVQWEERGGTVYGRLKDLDDDVTVGFTLWSSVRMRLTEPFSRGDRVVALVKPNYWLKGGTITMQVIQLRHVGIGALLERLEQLRRRLAAEGLFAAERKRRLPFLPRRIGLITGQGSDAEQDVVRNATLRWPAVAFTIVHAAMQGERTVAEVMGALKRLDADPEVEVIVIARGGGDFQNLLGFSDEGLVRAVAAASTPIVSAIGHEADRPLLDDVADLRASTPTDAAKRIVPAVAEELAAVRSARGRLAARVTALVAHETDRIAQLRSRPSLAEPMRMIESRSDELARWSLRGEELVLRSLDRAGVAIAAQRLRLRALSPQATLDRGYAIVHAADGRVLRRATEAAGGDPLRLVLAEGTLGATAVGVEPDVHRSPTTNDVVGGSTGPGATADAHSSETRMGR